ncbi:poly(A) RNA polymerase GLD2-like [Styela clava]
MNRRPYIPGFHSPYDDSLVFNFTQPQPSHSHFQQYSVQRKRPAPPRKPTYSAPLPMRFSDLHRTKAPTHHQTTQAVGSKKRYFDKSVKPGNVSSQNEQKIKGLKRKVFSETAPDFISLDANEPPRKHVRLEDASYDQNHNKPESLEPFSLRETRRLFISDSFSEQIHQFYMKNRQEENFLKKKQQLQSALENAINRTSGKDCKLVLVGSSINGFGRITSDADFCLIIDKYQEKLANRRRVMRTLYEVQQLLRKAPFARMLQVIPAKVPILKFTDSYSGMECDVNVNNLTGVRNTELMKRYAMLDPRVQPLALIIKEWAHQRKINDASQGTMNSYSLVLMVVHFLQCGMDPPVLPSLQVKYPELFRPTTPVMNVGSHGDRVKPYRSENLMNLSQLLKKFFEYFAETFDFEIQVMSVRLGKALYIDEIMSTGKEWGRMIKIEEPFDLTNTARAVHQDLTAERIIGQFRSANRILQRGKGLEHLLEGVSPRLKNNVIVLDDDS